METFKDYLDTVELEYAFLEEEIGELFPFMELHVPADAGAAYILLTRWHYIRCYINIGASQNPSYQGMKRNPDYSATAYAGFFDINKAYKELYKRQDWGVLDESIFFFDSSKYFSNSNYY